MYYTYKDIYLDIYVHTMYKNIFIHTCNKRWKLLVYEALGYCLKVLVYEALRYMQQALEAASVCALMLLVYAPLRL
jgi:hypothetical protein